MLGSSWVAAQLAASQEGLGSMSEWLDEGEYLASRSGRFTPDERDPGSDWIWVCVDFRDGLDNLEKRKMSCPFRESKSDCPARSPSLYRLSYPGYSDNNNSLPLRDLQSFMLVTLHDALTRFLFWWIILCVSLSVLVMIAEFSFEV
jgi:hypothetical protein